MGCIKLDISYSGLAEEKEESPFLGIWKNPDSKDPEVGAKCEVDFWGVDYYPFGSEMPGRMFNSTNYRYGFNGKERDSNGEFGGTHYDYGARIYSPLIASFLSIDPESRLYPNYSPYHFVRNNPILRLDPTGKWDITVHAYNDRSKYGYGIAILKDRNGNEVQRFKVRLEGTGKAPLKKLKRNRFMERADTPLGVYNIPSSGTWLPSNESNRESYGPNFRLVLEGESGEIMGNGRELLRVHGGRQEIFNEETGEWEEIENPSLIKTWGCLRCFDEDIAALKTNTDGLQAIDQLELPGKLIIIDDLVEKNGKYYTPYDAKELEEAKDIVDSDSQQGPTQNRARLFKAEKKGID